MSKFEVEVKTIDQVIQHPNADRLTIYKLNDLGYQFISNVPYDIGDKVVYFPVESVMTPELIELFGLGTMLAGKEHNRVKTVKLRKEISQGFIADVASVASHLNVDVDDMQGMDLTDALGITKYEPEPISCQNCDLVPLPDGVSKYDIEGCENYPVVVQSILDSGVSIIVTEKVEGQNFSVTVTVSGSVHVNQRNHSILEKDGGEHYLWEVARREKIIDLAKEILSDESAVSVSLYGEAHGTAIQGNYYKLSEKTVRFFDLKIDGKWTDANRLVSILRDKKLEDRMAPILGENVTLREWLGDKTIVEMSNGKSKINKDRLREGIVIRPMTESSHGLIGRLMIKQRDPIYLDKTGN